MSASGYQQLPRYLVTFSVLTKGMACALDVTDLPGFFGPLISRKMAPYERGAHEKESIHGRTDGRSAA